MCGCGKRRLVVLRILQAKEGCNALMCAAENGHTDCVRVLVDGGADMGAIANVRMKSNYQFFLLVW
jgi:hypothetical protein